MHVTRGWSFPEIQWAFTIFIATETWLTPLAGMIVDRLGPNAGPRVMIAGGGLMVGAGWVVNSYADSLSLLYLGAAISGTGGGAIYATCVGNAVKWFPDRRGLAVGLTAAGFGAGAALTVIPIRMTIAATGYDNAFLWFGLGQGLVLIAIAGVLRGPERPIVMANTANVHLTQSVRSFTASEMLRSPVFWLMYVMFIGVAASGLMATAQLGPIAWDYGISDKPILLGGTVLSVALVFDNVMNGLARPFFGAVSDRIGREKTMGVAFALGAASYGSVVVFGHSPWAFVVCFALIFFTWGEIFSLFPSTCTDTFGPKYATTNASLLYTAKGVGAFLVPLANVLTTATGSWLAVFQVATLTNVVVVGLALFVLKPMRLRQMRQAMEAGVPSG